MNTPTMSSKNREQNLEKLVIDYFSQATAQNISKEV